MQCAGDNPEQCDVGRGKICSAALERNQAGKRHAASCGQKLGPACQCRPAAMSFSHIERAKLVCRCTCCGPRHQCCCSAISQPTVVCTPRHAAALSPMPQPTRRRIPCAHPAFRLPAVAGSVAALCRPGLLPFKHCGSGLIFSATCCAPTHAAVARVCSGPVCSSARDSSHTASSRRLSVRKLSTP